VIKKKNAIPYLLRNVAAKVILGKIMSSEQSTKKTRITITLDDDVAVKIEEAAKRYGIPKSYYMVLATLEKIKKEEEK
jgi:hypothetical protein